MHWPRSIKASRKRVILFFGTARSSPRSWDGEAIPPEEVVLSQGAEIAEVRHTNFIVFVLEQLFLIGICTVTCGISVFSASLVSSIGNLDFIRNPAPRSFADPLGLAPLRKTCASYLKLSWLLTFVDQCRSSHRKDGKNSFSPTVRAAYHPDCLVLPDDDSPITFEASTYAAKHY